MYHELPLLFQGLIPSPLPELNELVDGGLRRGLVYEWGSITHGHEVLLHWLSCWQRQDAGMLTLWLMQERGLIVYPPSWEARGVALERTYFAQSTEPLRHARACFFESVFSLIVVDGVRLKTADWVFLAQAARRQKNIIFVVHPHPISNRFGNIWAKYRCNLKRSPKDALYLAQRIRGGAPLQKKILASELLCLSS